MAGTKRATAGTNAIATRAGNRLITSEYVAALLAYADILFKAGMCPKGKNTTARPETVAAIIEVGRDVGLPATQALAWIMLVNGKPSIWGDAGMALIRASGKLAEGYPKERYDGTPGEDDYTAVFSIKRNDGSPERVSTFSIEDAKRARLWDKEGPWKDYPYRQLMWRAKGFGCRDEFQDVLCGLVFTEEALDYPHITVTASVVDGPKKPEGAVTTDAAQQDQPETFPLTDVAASKPVTESQLDRLAELRDAVFTSRSLTDEDQCRAAWREILKPFIVTSAKDLTAAQAAELIEQLGKQHDPFTHPPGQNGRSAAPSQATTTAAA